MRSLCAALALAIGCGAGAREKPQRRMALERCRIKGIGRETLCGKLEVFEDRAAKRGRKIGIRVAVVPALARDASPDPLFLLAGGPGQAATDAFGPLMGAFDPVRKTRDLVLVDQRGTGGSHKLDCEMVPKDADLRTRLEAELAPEKFRACLGKLDADPRLYTTAIAMQDLDEVRAALGYERINLWGGSYGTRAALVYARMFPDRVRTLTLDGVAPGSLRLPLFFARDGQRALDLLVDHCAADKACGKRFPDLRGRLDDLLRRLEARPASIRVEDPLTGAPIDVTITRGRFVGIMRGLLYSADLTALLPLTLERAAAGDYRSFLAQADQLGSGPGGALALGMMLSVLCAEDVPFIAPDELERLSQGTFLGVHPAREFFAACSAWPRGAVAEGHREPVRSEAPALLLSGELDPVTPPSWAEDAARTLPRSKHVVVPGVGHGVTASGCLPDLVRDFIKNGTALGLDTRCATKLKRPPFFLGFAGPRP